MIVLVSYCWAAVVIVAVSSSLKTSSRCPLFFPRRRFLGLGTGVTNADFRRAPKMLFVGWPSASNSQCWEGYSYGELRIGRSKKSGVTYEPEAYQKFFR